MRKMGVLIGTLRLLFLWEGKEEEEGGKGGEGREES